MGFCFIELSGVSCVWAEFEFYEGDGVFVGVLFVFVGDESYIWPGRVQSFVVFCFLFLSEAVWAWDGRSGEPVRKFSVGPFVGRAAVCGEEALAFGAVCGESLEDDSAGCVVPVGVELGHGWMGAASCDVSA